MLDHRPESYISHHTSMVRNTISLTSLAIAIIGFAAFYKKRERGNSHLAMKLTGLFIFIYTTLYGAKGSINFLDYIKYLERREGDELPQLYVIQLKKWKEWIYFNLVFVVMIAIVSVVYLAHIINTFRK